MAAAAGMDFPDDQVVVEYHPRFQQWRKRQFSPLAEQLTGLTGRQRINTHDLHSQVIMAAIAIGVVDNELRSLIEIVAMIGDRLGDRPAAGVLIDAVGRQYEDVADLECDRLVVYLDLRIDPECAA